MDISSYLKAGYPVLYVVTQEQDRAAQSINAEGWQSFCWDCLRGVTDTETNRIVEDIPDPLHALKWLGGRAGRAVLAPCAAEAGAPVPPAGEPA